MAPLARLRLQLTVWYAGVFTLVFALLGGGLFLTIRQQMSRHVDKSLGAAAASLEQAARIRETERASAHGAVVDAVDELHIPERSLYLLDEAGHGIKPAAVPVWIGDAARQAVQSPHGYRDLNAPNGRDLRIYAERFTGTTGTPYIAAVVADRIELEDEYASLIKTFGAAALAALLLIAGGGYILVRKSTAPIERSMEQMRRFMADAAHELRTPITLLRTRADVAVGQTRDPTRDTTTFHAIEREAGRLGAIVGELLLLARADAGERPVKHEVLYLDDAAAGAVEARPGSSRCVRSGRPCRPGGDGYGHWHPGRSAAPRVRAVLPRRCGAQPGRGGGARSGDCSLDRGDARGADRHRIGARRRHPGHARPPARSLARRRLTIAESVDAVSSHFETERS